MFTLVWSPTAGHTGGGCGTTEPPDDALVQHRRAVSVHRALHDPAGAADTSTPRSVVLIGVRTLRDYALSVEERRAVAWLGTSSPFNVTVENVSLAPFTEAEVGELLGQHTVETGQRFEPDAIERLWELAQGHPWLVNALADQATRRDVRDRAINVTADAIERAKDTIILERRSHIDSLLARLREPRVRRVIDAMISGGRIEGDSVDDDFAYTAGLGLIRKVGGALGIANMIYREVILRTLTASAQDQIHQRTGWYLRPDGSLDMPKLMAAWQEFWREDGHVAAQGFGYQGSGPHLMLMAFLQRVINGGGRIAREYALGKDASTSSASAPHVFSGTPRSVRLQYWSP